MLPTGTGHRMLNQAANCAWKAWIFNVEPQINTFCHCKRYFSVLLHGWQTRLHAVGPGRFYKDISWWSKCVWAQPCIMHVQQSVQSSRNQGEMSANCAGRLTTVPFLLKPVTVSQRDVFFFPCLNYFRSVLFFRISILHNWLELHNDPSSSNILLSSGDVSIVLHLHAVSFLLHSGFDEAKWLKNSIWID